MLGPVPGTFLRLSANAQPLAFPAGRLVMRLGSVATVPGTVFSESARAFAFGDIAISAAYAPATNVKVPAIVIANNLVVFIILSFFVVRLSPRLFVSLNTPTPSKSLTEIQEKTMR